MSRGGPDENGGAGASGGTVACGANGAAGRQSGTTVEPMQGPASLQIALPQSGTAPQHSPFAPPQPSRWCQQNGCQLQQPHANRQLAASAHVIDRSPRMEYPFVLV
jgi:hypothetical protein